MTPSLKPLVICLLVTSTKLALADDNDNTTSTEPPSDNTTTTTTTVPTTTTENPAENVTQEFLNLFNTKWNMCKNNDSSTIKTSLTVDDVDRLITEEAVNFLIDHEHKSYNICYVYDLGLQSKSDNDSPDFTPLTLITANGTACEENKTTTYHVVTSKKDNVSGYLACLLHDNGMGMKSKQFDSVSLCLNTADKNSKPFLGFVACFDDEVAPPVPPPHPPSDPGFATGTFFGGIILGVIVVVLIGVGVKYKCGREGGFTQF